MLPETHPLAAAHAVPLEELAEEPFVTYPSHFRSVVHDAVETACAAQGFSPRIAIEVAETSTLVSFVAGGLGVSLVPDSVRHMTVRGAVYRPLARNTTSVELAVAWRCNDTPPVLQQALQVLRNRVGAPLTATVGASAAPKTIRSLSAPTAKVMRTKSAQSSTTRGTLCSRSSVASLPWNPEIAKLHRTIRACPSGVRKEDKLQHRSRDLSI